MTGLLDPTSGQIEILGQRFDADSAAIKRRIGVMPETLGLFEPLYAHEFLAFVARMFGLDETTTRRRVTELLDALELKDTSKTLSEYSTACASAWPSRPPSFIRPRCCSSTNPSSRSIPQACRS